MAVATLAAGLAVVVIGRVTGSRVRRRIRAVVFINDAIVKSTEMVGSSGYDGSPNGALFFAIASDLEDWPGIGRISCEERTFFSVLAGLKSWLALRRLKIKVSNVGSDMNGQGGLGVLVIRHKRRQDPEYLPRH